MNDHPGTEAVALTERLTADELPAVAAFLGGYLHEDFETDYRSAAQAAFAFAGEADEDDLQQLAAEWEVVRAAARALPLPELNRLLRERFRCGWYLLSASEVEGVAQELERALRE